MKSDKVNTLKLSGAGYPKILKHIGAPPKELFYIGADPSGWLNHPKIAIVGSRKMTGYGEQTTAQFASELASAGGVIISGLAIGVDAKAHEAALEAGGITVAILPTSLDSIYPASHRGLAEKIVLSGGTIISEYRSESEVYLSNFVARNRIVSGLADVLLITEAAAKSGSLHTARFALEQGKTVMAVPGNITSPSSQGCNNLIKSGALPVTQVEDVMFALNIKPAKNKIAKNFRGSDLEQKLLELIASGIRSQEELALASSFAGAEVSSALTMLEISGYIRPEGAGNWSLA